MKSFVLASILLFQQSQGLITQPMVGALPGQTPFNATDEWDRVQRAIATRFWAKDTRADEMKRHFDKWGPIAKAAKNQVTFAEAVSGMIKDFGDSHFAFVLKSDQAYHMMKDILDPNGSPIPMIGVWFKKSPEGYRAQYVLNDTAASAADIRKDDLFVSVDGKPFSPVEALNGSDGKTVNITLKRGAQTLIKPVMVKQMSPLKMFLESSQKSSKMIDYQGKKIGYLHMWTLLPTPEFRNVITTAVANSMPTDAFILDLRDGFGGRPESILNGFIGPKGKMEYVSSLMNQRTEMSYTKPMVILINEGSRSAKEAVALIFRNNKRGLLIGSRTAGHVLGTFPMNFGDWAILEIPMANVLVDGVKLEGVGVAPDIEVPKEFDENGKDLVLQKGLDTLLSQLR